MTSPSAISTPCDSASSSHRVTLLGCLPSNRHASRSILEVGEGRRQLTWFPVYLASHGARGAIAVTVARQVSRTRGVPVISARLHVACAWCDRGLRLVKLTLPSSDRRPCYPSRHPPAYRHMLARPPRQGASRHGSAAKGPSRCFLLINVSSSQSPPESRLQSIRREVPDKSMECRKLIAAPPQLVNDVGGKPRRDQRSR